MSALTYQEIFSICLLKVVSLTNADKENVCQLRVIGSHLLTLSTKKYSDSIFYRRNKTTDSVTKTKHLYENSVRPSPQIMIYNILTNENGRLI